MTVPPAIVSAAQDGEVVWLTLDNSMQYILSPDDPYGLAPHYRTELARMVEAGELTVGTRVPPPPPPAPPPKRDLLAELDALTKRIAALEGKR